MLMVLEWPPHCTISKICDCYCSSPVSGIGLFAASLVAVVVGSLLMKIASMDLPCIACLLID